jgi:hypothetical protein
MILCNVLNPPTCWKDVVFLGLEEWKGKTIEAYLYRLVFPSTIYNIWRNCNTLRHNNNPYTEEKLIQRIRWEVKIRFTMNGKFKKTRVNDILYSAWGIDGILV